MPIKEYIATGGIGWIVALIVLVLCVVLWFIGKNPSSAALLGLIAALAVARLI